MNETYLVTNTLDETEFVRSLCKNGINTIGFHVVNFYKLAQEALQRCGHFIKKTTLNKNQSTSLVFMLMNQNEYFQNSSLDDAQNLFKCFNVLRGLAGAKSSVFEIENVLTQGDFKDKNIAIMQVFKQYLSFLDENNLIDNYELIKLAIINNCKFLSNFICLSSDNLSNIEVQLLNCVSDENYQKKSIFELFNKSAGKTQISKKIKAYGVINEVEYILDDIFKNHQLDTCTIACVNPKTYINTFNDVCTQNDIPVIFGCGVSIKTTNPIKLATALINWETKSYHNVSSTYNLLNCEALDWKKICEKFEINIEKNGVILQKIAEVMGNLRISTDDQKNNMLLKSINDNFEYKKFIVKFCEYIKYGIVSFLNNFTLIRDDFPQDIEALSYINSTLDDYVKFNPDATINDIFDIICQKNVAQKKSEEGALYITDIDGIFSNPNKNIYICGLSANEFPGSAKEDYLLLDSDLQKFPNSVLSTDKIKHKVQTFNTAINLCNALNCSVAASYCYYDLVDLKSQNASSVLFTNDNDWIYANYFESNYSKSVNLCKMYMDGIEVLNSKNAIIAAQTNKLLDKKWSFSAIDTYKTCPRKFYFKYVLKIPDVDIQDDFCVITPAEFGSLSHKMMDYLGNHRNISKEEFKILCSQSFDTFIMQKQSVIEDKKNIEKNKFVNVMMQAYDFDKSQNYQLVQSETDISAKHQLSGVVLHGFPDRIELNENKYIVVDFKTGNNVSHKEDDADTCLQVLIYAFLCEKNFPEIKIACGQFRYLKNSAVINCTYSEVAKNSLNKQLQKFADGIKNCDFGKCEKSCNFCTYADVCNNTQDIIEKGDVDGS